MRKLSALFLLFGLVVQANAAVTDVSYRCVDADRPDLVSLNFHAQVSIEEFCGSRPYYSWGSTNCTPHEVRAGSAVISVLGSEDERYRFMGVSPNPNLIDHVGYVFQRSLRRSGFTNHLASLTVYVRLGNPERSYYTVATERGLQERREVSCEITH